MTFKSTFIAGLLLMLGGCAAMPERPPAATATTTAQPTRLDATALLSELTRVASLSPEQRRRELAVLEGERRLDDARRFQLAALLEREDSVEALERSLKTLGAITDLNPRAQPLAELMKKSIKARIELKQQTARTQELQDKLDQIKALEKSLQQRNIPDKTP
jgi:ABC-type Fe3+-hydroxamate transport system substrate-binding protein